MSVEYHVNVKSQSELDIGGRETCLCLFPDCSAVWTDWARWFSPGGVWTTPAPQAPATWPQAAW